MLENEAISLEKEKVLIIGTIRPGMNERTVNEYLDELELLVDTAGANVSGRIIQKISKINASTFIGKGKANQLINQATDLGVKILVFDDELTPAQIKNYHKISDNLKVLDRSGLILDIFKRHARSKESTTQVELAYLEYLLPRLTRQWTHLERQMGGIGTRAGMGETQIEVDRRLIRTKITKLKKDLVRIEKEREIKSMRRKSEFRVSLVGYTNAGKSTLFKALTGSEVFIKNQLFATLDTTVRHLSFDSSHSVLLSDTVGFIRKLPHNLVASFKSTLKEVVESDLILMVLDISSEQIKDHSVVIQDVLKSIGADKIPIINVLNKVDLISENAMIEKIKKEFSDSIIISAQRHLRLSQLKGQIIKRMEENYQTLDVELSYSQGKMIAKIKNTLEVLEETYEENIVKMKIRGNRSIIKEFSSKLNSFE
ncbi:GTPase HflX [Candidatus Marinimicrobia bacterium]|jgi:GTP-binding protein HflX|nr:GTPase HflX [Candidatus Neomarinimicrobiota bacterium]|tara:strand:+ start:2732 stop:4012 length:1281 start_codon:yes stop_codon:yes gene_type:complete